jgi:epoxyqueuosine reductase QueG
LNQKTEYEMARETVAQRNARYAQERETYLANQVAEYPQRLMLALARATNAYFELTVSDNRFQLRNVNDRYDSVVSLAYAHSPNSQEQLESLEYDLDSYEKRLAEAQRLREVKAEALRKVNELLTAEERELLNL